MPINFVNTIINKVNIDGVTLKKITVDGSTVFSAEHSYKVVERVDPTCRQEGYEVVKCEWCGDTFTQTTSAALGHSWSDWNVLLEPTCTAVGLRKRTCTRSGCGAYEEEILSQIAHSYTPKVTEPTCTEKGYTTYTCACGDSYVDNYTDKLDHDYEVTEVFEPTCTKDGYTVSTCKRCSHKKQTTLTLATGHSEESTVTVAPTCTEKGKTSVVCTKCGETLYTYDTDPLGHDYGEWLLLTKPTQTTDGSKKRTCNRCGKVQYGTLDHQHDFTYITNEDGTVTVVDGGIGDTSEIIIPGSFNEIQVNSIGGKAFFTTPIEAVFIEPGVARVGGAAFYKCQQLRVALLPSSITEIEPLAFAGCDNATIYCEAESKPEGWADDWVDDSVTVVWGHTHTNSIISVLPTCTKKGYTLSTCEVCGYKQQSNITPALGHSWKDATCTKPKTCNVCGETEGEALGHTWEDATCTTPKTCSVCGATEGEALGHTEVSIPPVPPTCTEAGLTEGKKCSVCGEITFAPIPFPTTGHTWSAWEETIAPSCITEGEEKRTCSVCGATETRTVEATGHDYYELEVKEPTCTQSGYTVYMCSRCGDQYTDHEVEATGEHNHPDDNWEILAEPTCGEDGYKINKCTTCVDSLGIHTLEEFIPATGDHTWGAWVTETDPTCTTVGSRKHTCSVCGTVETEEIPIDATEHNFGDWETVIPATCEVEGVQERKCTRCGETESRSYPSTGHNWSDWNIDIEPTCTEKGSKTCTCTNCGTFKSEDIAALGHDYVIRPVEPTCTEQGYTSNTCSRCGDTFNGAYVDALGHDWDVEVEVVEPTCITGGYTIHTCNRCGTTYKDNYTDALGHTPSDWIIDKEATVEAEGSKHKECTRCGATLETATIPKVDNSIYLVTEAGEYLTDEQGNLLIL